MKSDEQKEINLSKNEGLETLSEQEHKLLVEGYSDQDNEAIYELLKELDIADLTDYFLWERSYGRN